ncbi:MAG: PQQ-binding-like beta-propeller repeat protein [Opitutaceae bacterium]|nr:PQQ-binding-like beta-propeller repeat protein [Opitutaceae bacterium]
MKFFPSEFRLLLVCLATIPCGASELTDWPEFRGPTGQGHASAKALPTEWSATKNVAWKVPVPGAGWSSPAIAGGRIFLTTGVENGSGGVSLRALAFDLASGRALWDTEIIPASEASVKPIHTKNSPASPTPIIEGDRVYVHFGHHGTACLDRDGKILWRQTSLRYDPVHGNGGSPALVGDLLVFSADGAKEPAIVALRKGTGEIAWKVAREADVRQKFSFSTPLVIEVGGRTQIITPGSGAVSALDPRDGREIWRVRYGGGYSVVPRPVFAHELLFVGTGYNRADLLAIRADGEGDVTDTHIVWRTTKGAPLTPSVLAVGDELYAVADSGVVTCFDAKTGTVHWQERIAGNYSASPIHAEGKLYFLSEDGIGTVLMAGRTFETIAVNKIEERTLASYAVADGALFLRSAAHLYRIGRP